MTKKIAGCFFIGKIILLLLCSAPAIAGVSAIAPYRSTPLAAPDPAVFNWHASIAYYNDQLIYLGDDSKIYAMDTLSGISVLVCDTSAIGSPWVGAASFFIASDGYMYFHDNGNNPDMIYRVDLAGAWPLIYEALDTNCQGWPYLFTQNPLTGNIWFSSSDFFLSIMYLYEISAIFDAANQRANFAAPNGGGTGPIVFSGANTLLYGESVWGGDGYFHLVNTDTGNIISQDYITFPGGLCGAVYGFDNMLYAISGIGNKLYKINGTSLTEVATADDGGLWGITFGDAALYLSEMTQSGDVSFYKLCKTNPGDVNGDGEVDMSDFRRARFLLGLSAGDPGYNENADMNGDGKITWIDIILIRRAM